MHEKPDPAGPEDPLSHDVVLDLLQRLIRCPSVNPTLVPGEGHGEATVARAARDWLVARGVQAWTEVVRPGRANTVARVDGGGSGAGGKGPALVLCAHLDTVGTAGMTIDPFDPRVDGDRVYGRGSFDMKGGVAATMAAAAALAGERFGGTLLLALVADEEYASLGAQHFVEHHRADACIVTEPSDGQLVLAHKGFVWLELRTTGTAAHGSRWDVGTSAIGRMGRIVAALETFDRDVLRKRSHPLLGPASLHCAIIAGGDGLSTYAASCTLRVERRTLPGETAAAVVRDLQSVVAAAGEEAAVDVLLERRPLETDRDARVAAAVREAATETTGAPPAETGVAYWMDAAIFDGAGMPTVDIGPAGAGAHAAVEWTSLDSVVGCARTLVAAVRRFCR